MGKGKSGDMLGAGGTRSSLPRTAMHGTPDRAGRRSRHGEPAGKGFDPMAEKRELLRRMREKNG